MKRTKAGERLYAAAVACGRFLSKRAWLWHLLSATWGLPMTLAGALATLLALCLGGKARVFHGTVQTEVGGPWGGVSLGLFALVGSGMGDSWERHTREHEVGHSFQNAALGPIFPFAVGLPSAVRYWRDRSMRRRGLTPPPYELIWFEASATDAGRAHCAGGE